MEEERLRILEEKRVEKEKIAAETKKLLGSFKKKFKRHLLKKIKEEKDK